MTGTLRFTLLGTGSSGGVPRIGNDWGVCDPDEPKNRRSRCSALAEVFSSESDEPTRILIDTSPDMREQLLRENVDRLDAIVFTHEHADQVGGLDDVRVLVLRQRARMPVFLDAATNDALRTRFAYCFEGVGGYPAILDPQPLIEAYEPFTVRGHAGPVTIMPLDQKHGHIRSLGFRIGDLAYCNDLNRLPERSLSLLEGIDTFIIDALRYTEHPSHANLDQALAWVAQLKPRRTILTNMHVDLDYKTLLETLPDGVEPGFDSLSLEIPYD
ncbi:MAG: MBL fold metallo-hydrolase [Pseudomonadota bacterium]